MPQQEPTKDRSLTDEKGTSRRTKGRKTTTKPWPWAGRSRLMCVADTFTTACRELKRLKLELQNRSNRSRYLLTLSVSLATLSPFSFSFFLKNLSPFLFGATKIRAPGLATLLSNCFLILGDNRSFGRFLLGAIKRSNNEKGADPSETWDLRVFSPISQKSNL